MVIKDEMGWGGGRVALRTAQPLISRNSLCDTEWGPDAVHKPAVPFILRFIFEKLYQHGTEKSGGPLWLAMP